MYKVKPARVAIGVVLGSLFPVAFAAATGLWGPVWVIATFVATLCALIADLVVVWPFYGKLRAAGQLRMWWFVLLGAVLVVVPYFLILFPLSVFQGENSSFYAYGATLISRGSPTPKGWLLFAVIQPMQIMPAGAAGGLIGWIIAFGFCLEPSRFVHAHNGDEGTKTKPIEFAITTVVCVAVAVGLLKGSIYFSNPSNIITPDPRRELSAEEQLSHDLRSRDPETRDRALEVLYADAAMGDLSVQKRLARFWWSGHEPYRGERNSNAVQWDLISLACSRESHDEHRLASNAWQSRHHTVDAYHRFHALPVHRQVGILRARHWFEENLPSGTLEQCDLREIDRYEDRLNAELASD
jgi:hypothetical protein